MPFIDMGEEFGTTSEDQVHPEKEADLEIIKVDDHEKDGKKSIRCLIAINEPAPGDKKWADIFHYVALPHPVLDKKKDEEKGNPIGQTSRYKRLMAKRFCHTFNIPMTDQGFNTGDFLHAKGRCLLGIETDQSNSRRNHLKLPELPDEAMSSGPAPKPKAKAAAA